MPKDCEQVALWAQSCGLQCGTGVSLIDALESCSSCFGSRRRAQVTERLRRGDSIVDAFKPLFPDLTYADIAFLQGAQKAGNLSEGFSLLASQYFIRARTQSVILTAFIYPIGIFLIGLFLMSLQQVLYGELPLKPAATQFGTRIVITFLGIYMCKRIVCLRPPILRVVLRFVPPFRGLSRSLAAQRFIWLLEKSSIAAIPINESVSRAADASGRLAVIRRADIFRRDVARGTEFGQSFQMLLRAWPKSLRRSITIHSPNHLPDWSRPISEKNDESTVRAIGWVERLSKPVALVLSAPFIFGVIKNLWNVMAAELSERFGSLM